MAKRSKHGRDRISELPEPIIHHIFSFLPENYMVSLCMVSKQFTQLCLTTPHLKFSRRQLRKGPSRVIQFCRFVDKFIHVESTTIKSFELSLVMYRRANYAKERSCLFSWFQQIANCNVEAMKLNLHLPEKKPRRNVQCDIPKSVVAMFTCTSLKFLEIIFFDRAHSDHNRVELPLVVLGSLEHLTLREIVFVGKISITEWVSTSCPSLTKLNLFSVSHWPRSVREFKITHHVLEEIEISGDGNYTYFGEFSISGDNLRVLCLRLRNITCIHISAPNLDVLELNGSAQPGKGLLDMSAVTNATFDVYPLCNPCPQWLVEVLKAVSSANVIRLTIEIIEVLFIRDKVPIFFENISTLEIIFHERSRHTDIQVIDDFISRFPSLESLTIGQSGFCRLNSQMIEIPIVHPQSDVRIQMPSVLPKVKEVKIELSDGKKNNIDTKLVEYFVDHMDSWEKMTIYYKDSSSSPFKILSDYLETRPGFPQNSK